MKETDYQNIHVISLSKHSVLVIWLEASAITPPKRKWLSGWNLEHSEYIVGGLALADFGRDARSNDSLRGRWNFLFLSGK